MNTNMTPDEIIQANSEQIANTLRDYGLPMVTQLELHQCVLNIISAANGAGPINLQNSAAVSPAEKAAVLKAAELPSYRDSTPELHVGDSSFEGWFAQQPFATQSGVKQIARDSYAAGMGDPLVIANPNPTDHETTS